MSVPFHFVQYGEQKEHFDPVAKSEHALFAVKTLCVLKSVVMPENLHWMMMVLVFS